MSGDGRRTTAEVALSARYLATVGGLLVLIIALLAVLWMRERGRRVRAETLAARLEFQNRQLGALVAQSALGGLLPASQPAIEPFRRADHVPVRVVLDGRERPAYRLSAEGGRRFGFEPGDVILVHPADPASMPAEAPPGG